MLLRPAVHDRSQPGPWQGAWWAEVIHRVEIQEDGSGHEGKVGSRPYRMEPIDPGGLLDPTHQSAAYDENHERHEEGHAAGKGQQDAESPYPKESPLFNPFLDDGKCLHHRGSGSRS